MSAQTSYKYSSSIGSPGGIVDITPHVIDSFLNGEDAGVMKFGVGVVQGDTPGTDVKLPTATATSAVFEGVTVNNLTTEYDVEGKVHLRNGKALGVMRYGRVYVRVATGISSVAPAYGSDVYLVTSGANAGLFIDRAAENSEAFTTLQISARFLGGVDTSAEIAAIELFNSGTYTAQAAHATTADSATHADKAAALDT